MRCVIRSSSRTAWSQHISKCAQHPTFGPFCVRCPFREWTRLPLAEGSNTLPGCHRCNHPGFREIPTTAGLKKKEEGAKCHLGLPSKKDPAGAHSGAMKHPFRCLVKCKWFGALQDRKRILSPGHDRCYPWWMRRRATCPVYGFRCVSCMRPQSNGTEPASLRTCGAKSDLRKKNTMAPERG